MLLKEEILSHYQNHWLFLNFRFFEHSLILTKCLVPCMFELTDLCCINLILIILPSRCFPLKFFYLPQNCVYLTKLLPTMTSIWLNYINSFWLFRECIKTCFRMRKHINISRMIINFLMILQKQNIVKLEEIVIYY